MMKMTWIGFVLVAATACAGVQRSGPQDLVAGHWMGAIDRDGWQRPLALDIGKEGGAYGGSWMSLEAQPGVMLDRVEVNGDDVRFQLKTLAFAGHVTGRSLSGSVTDTASGAASGQFTLTRVDPHAVVVP
jgi:hypothetical protein